MVQRQIQAAGFFLSESLIVSDASRVKNYNGSWLNNPAAPIFESSFFTIILHNTSFPFRNGWTGIMTPPWLFFWAGNFFLNRFRNRDSEIEKFAAQKKFADDVRQPRLGYEGLTLRLRNRSAVIVPVEWSLVATCWWFAKLVKIPTTFDQSWQSLYLHSVPRSHWKPSR